MAHPLDNPLWLALRTRQSHMAEGEGRALRYRRDHAIFAAVPDDGPASRAALGALVAATGPALLFGRSAVPPVPGTRVEKRALGVQMVAEDPLPPDPAFAFAELGEADAAEMLALATQTEPGPFFARTHRLGRFVGVREQGRLVAMAGERIKVAGFTEVSGVCTDPGFRGRGLAGGLMREVAGGITAAGETPFLHAYADNKGAIGLYERLGYRIRCEVQVTVLVPLP